MDFDFPSHYFLCFFHSRAMNLIFYEKVEAFLKENCPTSEPFLLALSGGPDSLALFYCLLEYREREGIPFHVAHVDHGWRKESGEEAQILGELAAQKDVPFHLKKLENKREKKNLEAFCREERHAFFASLMKKYSLQTLLTGHHLNDRAETILKRIFEGGHWSNWEGIQPISVRDGFRILRPFLNISKKEIQEALDKAKIFPFTDPTNFNTQFLRARFREQMIPHLNQQFGKDIQKCLIEIGDEAGELVDYFDALISPYLKNKISGPFGCYLSLEKEIPSSLLELKYLLRQLSRSEGFFLSREIIEGAVDALMKGKANLKFEMGNKHLYIDRKKIFILDATLHQDDLNHSLSIGLNRIGQWCIDVRQGSYEGRELNSWQEGWRGSISCSLPFGNYFFSLNSHIPSQMRKRWSEAKIPSFLNRIFPLIRDNEENYCEFLTGRNPFKLELGASCLKILLTYHPIGPNVKI